MTARRIVQYLALTAFLVFFIGTQRTGLPADTVNLPMRLDPLLMVSHLLSSRTFLAGSAVAFLTILLTLVFGRAWCGWLCPLGTILDLLPLTRNNPRIPAENWRGVKYNLLLATLVAALFGNLTLLFLDPLTILLRGLSAGIWPALDWILTTLEAGLYHIPTLSQPITRFDGWIRPGLLPSEPLVYQHGLIYAAIFLGVIALNLFAPRFWCRYLCPLGALLGLISKIAVFRRRVDKECRGCLLCTKVCSTGTIDASREYRSDPGECTVCMNCVETCPRGLSAFKPILTPGKWTVYDPGRREALITIGAAIIGVALFKSSLLVRRQSPFLLRPPGTREVNPDPVALTRCIRCGECVRICPTGVIQPAALEAGLEGSGTPILIMRAGYCNQSCNACGQVCPVQAIPPLRLEEKQTRVIGIASIDPGRCLPWTIHHECLVCEEMCPQREKAIWLEEVEVKGQDGSPVTVRLPHVLREKCIGCGLCEYKCPVSGEAAIRVYIPPVSVPF